MNTILNYKTDQLMSLKPSDAIDYDKEAKKYLEQAIKDTTPGYGNKIAYNLACKLRDLGLEESEYIEYIINYAETVSGF